MIEKKKTTYPKSGVDEKKYDKLKKKINLRLINLLCYIHFRML